jgi:hypothetical protein
LGFIAHIYGCGHARDTACKLSEINDDNNKVRKQTKVAAPACIVYLLLTIFYHHIDKYSPDALRIVLTLLIPVAFIVIVVYFIKGLITILRNRKHLSFLIFLPTLISLTTLAYTFFSPWRLDSEKLESPVVIRACFEGTQNQAYIKMRKDKSFEINWTGVFLYDEWFFGTYSQKGDTIFLNYKTDKPYRFGDTILNNGSSLIPLNKFKKDSLQYFVPFYLGYCKGLN